MEVFMMLSLWHSHCECSSGPHDEYAT